MPRTNIADPLQTVGGLFAMVADAVMCVFRRPFQTREFVEQSSFVARVDIVLMAIPFTVLVGFTLNILLWELGAADFSGAGAALGAVTQLGPLVTVLIVAGATAMCAHLGPRTIREDIDTVAVLTVLDGPGSDGT